MKITKKDKFAEITGLEVFKIGTTVTKNYTEEDLDNMVAKLDAGVLEPPVVISHAEEQALLEADKLPAAGWIKKLYREGASLFADISDVPVVVAELIKNKAIKNRSAEIYANFTDDAGTSHGKVFRRLALLGGAIPKIKSLSDHLNLYDDDKLPAVAFSEANKEQVETVTFESFGEIEDSLEQDIKEDEARDKMYDAWWAFQDKLRKMSESEEMTDEDKAKRRDTLLAELTTIIQDKTKEIFGFSESATPTKIKEVIMPKPNEQDVKDYAEKFAEEHGMSPEEMSKQFQQMKKDNAQKAIDEFSEELKRKGVAPKLVDQFNSIHKDAEFDSFSEEEPVTDRLKKFMTNVAESIADGSAYVEFNEQAQVSDQDPTVGNADTKKYPKEAQNVDLMQKAQKYAEEHKVDYPEALEIVSETIQQ